MKIEYFENYDLLCKTAASQILADLAKKPDLLLCTASGNSPTGVYRYLQTAFQARPSGSKQLRILKLDEWGGIPLRDPNSCETYLKNELIDPLKIEPDRYISFDSDPCNKEMECARIADWIKNNGPIDCCVLGLGLNGHIAFNEPSSHLNPFCHVAELSNISLQHRMASEMRVKPTYGLSLGMSEILQSRKIIMLITGAKKHQIIKQFLSAKISTTLPASLLWLHPNVVSLVEESRDHEFHRQ